LPRQCIIWVYKVTAFEITGAYTLKVCFDDGISRTIDFLPVLAGPMYGALVNAELFAKVKIDPEIQTFVWPNGVDFDPETLHDWPDNIDAFYAMIHACQHCVQRCAEDTGKYDSPDIPSV
jgi:hypothetical protein